MIPNELPKTDFRPQTDQTLPPGMPFWTLKLPPRVLWGPNIADLTVLGSFWACFLLICVPFGVNFGVHFGSNFSQKNESKNGAQLRRVQSSVLGALWSILESHFGIEFVTLGPWGATKRQTG